MSILFSRIADNTGTASVTIVNCVSTDYLLGAFVKPDSANTYTPSGGATELYEGNISGLTTRRVVAQYRTGVTGSQAIATTFASTFHGAAGTALQEATAVTSRPMFRGS